MQKKKQKKTNHEKKSKKINVDDLKVIYTEILKPFEKQIQYENASPVNYYQDNEDDENMERQFPNAQYEHCNTLEFFMQDDQHQLFDNISLEQNFGTPIKNKSQEFNNQKSSSQSIEIQEKQTEVSQNKFGSFFLKQKQFKKNHNLKKVNPFYSGETKILSKFLPNFDVRSKKITGIFGKGQPLFAVQKKENQVDNKDQIDNKN